MLIVEPLNIRRDHKGQCLYRSEDAIRICREVGSQYVKINWLAQKLGCCRGVSGV